jgi:hypothetical protein
VHRISQGCGGRARCSKGSSVSDARPRRARRNAVDVQTGTAYMLLDKMYGRSEGRMSASPPVMAALRAEDVHGGLHIGGVQKIA